MPNYTANHNVVRGEGKVGRVSVSEPLLKLRYFSLPEVAIDGG